MPSQVSTAAWVSTIRAFSPLDNCHGLYARHVVIVTELGLCVPARQGEGSRPVMNAVDNGDSSNLCNGPPLSGSPSAVVHPEEPLLPASGSWHQWQGLRVDALRQPSLNEWPGYRCLVFIPVLAVLRCGVERVCCTLPRSTPGSCASCPAMTGIHPLAAPHLQCRSPLNWGGCTVTNHSGPAPCQTRHFLSDSVHNHTGK